MPDDDEILLGRLRAKYGGGGAVAAEPEDPDAVHLRALAKKYAPAPADDGGISAGAGINVGPDRPEAISGAFREPKSKGAYLYDEFKAKREAAAAAPDTFPVNRESRARLIQAKDIAVAGREGNPKWAEAVAAGDGPSTAGQFAGRFPNIKTQEDADFAEAQMGQSRRASRTAEEVADDSVVENVAKKSPLMRGVLNAGTTVAGFARAATGGYFGGLIGHGERKESEKLDKLNAALEDADGWTKYLHAGGEGIGAGVGIGGLARGIGIGKAMATYGAVATPGGVKERVLGAAEMAAFGKVAQFLTPSTQKMLARLPETLRGPVIAKAIDLADEFAGGVGSEVFIRATKGEDITAEALVLSGFLNAAQASLRKVVTDAPPAPDAPAPEAPARPVEAPKAEAVPEATPRVAEPVAAPVEPVRAAEEPPRVPVEAPPAVAPDSPVPAPEAPAAPREEVIQPEAGESPEVASIKNRLMNRDRVRRGLGEIKTEFKETFKEWGDEALDRVAENPRAPEAVVDALAKSMRSPDKVESALLTIRRVDLNRDLLAADAKGRAAGERGDKAGAEEAKIEADAILEKFAVLDDIGLRGGAEAGRNLVARKMEMANDYSLVKMENDLRREQGYKKLTPEESSRQMAETKRLHDELAKAVADRDTWKARVEEIEARKGKARAAPGPKAPEYGKSNKVVTREAYEATKVAVREKLNRLNAGIDPTLLLDLAKMGAFHVEAGARNFAAWAKSMREELAENAAKAEPHLQAIWNEAHKQIKAATFAEVSGKVTAGLKAGKPLAEMKGPIDKIALQFEREGVKDRAELIDKVHEVLKGIDPTITRRTTQEVLSGYGQVTRPSDDPAKVALREHKGETQQDLKLEDMAAGKAPLASGPQRQPPGDVLRELIKQVNDAKRKGGYGTPDPATSLRTAMDAVKTRLRHELADLARQIDAGKKDIAKRTALTYDAEATALREQRDALKEVYDNVFGKSELTPEQRTEMALRAVKKANADAEARLAAGDVFPAPKVSKTPETPELAAERAKRKALAEQAADMRAAATPRESWSQIAEAAREARLTKQAETLERRLETGQLEAPARRPAVPPTPEAIRLEARVDTLKRTIAERVFAAKLANRNKAQKAAAAGFETIATARALMTSFDFSAVLRQGGFIALGSPLRAARASGAMFKAAGRPIMAIREGGLSSLFHPLRTMMRAGELGREAQARIEAEIRLRPNYRLSKASGLYLSEHGNTPYSKMEEAYMGRWAEKVPGVAGSQRAYTTFLNRLRMDSFDAMVGGLSKSGTPTPQEAKAIANYINVATGRGGAKDSQLLAGLNGILFSPRLMASRFQLLLRPLSGFRQGAETSLRVRKMVAGEYARFLGGVAIMYGLGLAAGAEIEVDPRSSAFGKMRWKGDKGGETYVDGLAGLAQVTTLLAREVTGQIKEKSRGGGRPKVRSLSEDVGYGKSDAWDVFVKFMRSKLAPLPAAVVDVRSGEDINHEKTTIGGEVAGLVTPMLGRDIFEAMREQGIPKGAAFGFLSMFGMSIQTHEKRRGGK